MFDLFIDMSNKRDNSLRSWKGKNIKIKPSYYYSDFEEHIVEAKTKLAYVYFSIRLCTKCSKIKTLNMLRIILMEETGAKSIRFYNLNKHLNMTVTIAQIKKSYVYEQGRFFDEILENKETLRNFIFNPGSRIIRNVKSRSKETRKYKLSVYFPEPIGRVDEYLYSNIFEYDTFDSRVLKHIQMTTNDDNVVEYKTSFTRDPIPNYLEALVIDKIRELRKDGHLYIIGDNHHPLRAELESLEFNIKLL